MSKGISRVTQRNLFTVIRMTYKDGAGLCAGSTSLTHAEILERAAPLYYQKPATQHKCLIWKLCSVCKQFCKSSWAIPKVKTWQSELLVRAGAILSTSKLSNGEFTSWLFEPGIHKVASVSASNRENL